MQGAIHILCVGVPIHVCARYRWMMLSANQGQVTGGIRTMGTLAKDF